MMEPEEDGWFWAAVVVLVAAMCAWAFSLVTGIGSTWLPWAAVIAFLLALASVGFRAWLRNKDVVWTEEMKEAQRHRAWRQLLEIIWLSPIPVGFWSSKGLVEAGILPAWASAILLLLSLVAVFVLRYAIRSRAWKDLG
jgi:hypothetical protein